MKSNDTHEKHIAEALFKLYGLHTTVASYNCHVAYKMNVNGLNFRYFFANWCDALLSGECNNITLNDQIRMCNLEKFFPVIHYDTLEELELQLALMGLL